MSEKRPASETEAPAPALPLLRVHDLTPAVPPRPEDLHLVVQVEQHENRKIMYKSGKGSLFSVVLRDRDNDIVDAKNLIKLTLFSSCKQYENWFQILQKGTVVRIWMGKVKPVNDPRYNDTNHKYELNLGDLSEIDVLTEAQVRDNYWTFGGKTQRSAAGVTCAIGDLLQHTPTPEQDAAKESVDPVSILGIVIHFVEMEMGSKNSYSWQRSKVVLGSPSMHAIEVTIWGDLASQDFSVGQVLLMQNLKISSYNTCTLSTMKSSHIEVVTSENMQSILVPELHAEIVELESWFDPDHLELSKNTSEFQHLSKWDRNSASNRAKMMTQAERCDLGELQGRADEARTFIQQSMQDSAVGVVDASMYYDDPDVQANYKPITIPSEIASQVTTGSYRVQASVIRIISNPKKPITVPCCSNEIPISAQNGSVQTSATRVCGKWVSSDPSGWSCASCHTVLPTCLYTYSLPIEIADAFGSCNVILYNEAVKALLGGIDAHKIISEELRSDTLAADAHFISNQLVADRITTALQDREVDFVLKSAPDAHKGLKFTCDVVQPVDYDKLSEELMKQLV